MQKPRTSPVRQEPYPPQEISLRTVLDKPHLPTRAYAKDVFETALGKLPYLILR